MASQRERKEQQPAVVTLFGSGSPEPGSRPYEAARELGAGLARAGFVLCNGGYGGTMEASARGARGEDGHVIGVTLERADWGEPNRWSTELISRPDLPTRTMSLIQRGDAYVVLPGGTGTLSELGLLLELIGKRHVDPRPLVLVGDFWMPVVGLMREEKVFRSRVDYRTVEGVEMIGQVARADGPGPAVRFLEANLLAG